MPSPAPCEGLEAGGSEEAPLVVGSPCPQQAPTQRPFARRARAALAAGAGAAAAALATAGALAVHRRGSQVTSNTADERVVSLSEAWDQACWMSSEDGEDCGFEGITQAECEDKGCCYDESNSKWCWRPGSPDGELLWECDPSVAAEGGGADGGDCGWEGVTQWECENAGCCYDESNPDKWCFPKTPVDPTRGSGAISGGIRLFCFAVACSDEENAVLDLQRSQNAGIFACEEWKRVRGQTSGMGGGLTKSWTNVDTFIAAWKSVEGDGRWRNNDWTVKADPDTVWVPQRLRDWLGGQGDPGSAFISNCGGVLDGFYGALEVMSWGAVDTYLRELDSCAFELQGEEGMGMGEDLFAEWCMKSKGVEKWENGDLICNTDCGCDPRPCDTGRIAYHPFKGVEDHANCLSQL